MIIELETSKGRIQATVLKQSESTVSVYIDDIRILYGISPVDLNKHVAEVCEHMGVVSNVKASK